MYFEDLSLLHYHSREFSYENWSVPLRAVGWLESPYVFKTNESVQQPFYAALDNLVNQAILPGAQERFRGLHSCSLCQAENKADVVLPHSHSNLFVPGEDEIYCAPAEILHYVDIHAYSPPVVFLAAVLRCPPYGSDTYYEVLLSANGGHVIPLSRR